MDCEFDGGDCCGDSVNQNHCFTCECHHEGIQKWYSEKAKFSSYSFSLGVDCSATSNCICNWWADGECDDANNVPECQYDGGDCCLEPLDKGVCTLCECIVPTTTTIKTTTTKTTTTGDGFDYTGCVWWPGVYFGDGICDSVTNNAECNWDGGDCPRPDTTTKTTTNPGGDGFDYSSCIWWPGVYFGDGICDSNTNTAECNWDGGDCPRPDTTTKASTKAGGGDFDYSDCIWWPGPYFGDGICDTNANTAECNWDGGDC